MHRPNRNAYEKFYYGAHMNAVIQDAFLGHDTASPFLAKPNHIGPRVRRECSNMRARRVHALSRPGQHYPVVRGRILSS